MSYSKPPRKPATRRTKVAAGTLAVVIPFVALYEGLRNVAYRDPVGIPTICFGHTENVRMGDYRTTEECKAMLIPELEKANYAVSNCLHDPISDRQRAGFVSLVYNAGPKAVCGSTLQRRWNSGDRRGACDAILMWKYAKGVELPGLVRRRKEERELCLTDL